MKVCFHYTQVSQAIEKVEDITIMIDVYKPTSIDALLCVFFWYFLKKSIHRK